MPKKKSSPVTKYDRNLTSNEFKLFILFLLSIGAFLFYTLIVNNKLYVPSYNSPSTYQPSSSSSGLKKTPAPTIKAKTPAVRAK